MISGIRSIAATFWNKNTLTGRLGVTGIWLCVAKKKKINKWLLPCKVILVERNLSL